MKGLKRSPSEEIYTLPNGRKVDPIYEAWKRSGEIHGIQPWEKEKIFKASEKNLYFENQPIGDATSDFLQFGVAGITGLTKAIPAIGKYLASWATPLVATGTTVGIEAIRKENPELHPTLDHYLAMGSTIAGYVAIITGLGTGKEKIGRALDKTTYSAKVGKYEISADLASSPAQTLKGIGEKIDSWLSTAGEKMTSWMPDAMKKRGKQAHDIYSLVADWTGSAISDVVHLPRRLKGHSDEIAALTKDAYAHRKQALEIAQARDSLNQTLKIGDDIAALQGHAIDIQDALLDPNNALRLYDEAYIAAVKAQRLDDLLTKAMTKGPDPASLRASAAQTDQLASARLASARTSADEALDQSAAILTESQKRLIQIKDDAYQRLLESHKASLAREPGARQKYLQAAYDFHDAERAVIESQKNANALAAQANQRLVQTQQGADAAFDAADAQRRRADFLAALPQKSMDATADAWAKLDIADTAADASRQFADDLQQSASWWQSRIAGSDDAIHKLLLRADELDKFAAQAGRKMTEAKVKAGLVVGGIIARDIYDQTQIRERADEIKDTLYRGDTVARNLSQGRDPLATAAAIAAGTLGNPVEKLLRFGQSEYIDQRAIYLATRDMIDDAESIGYLTPEEAARYRRLASLRKPQNMAGKAAWQFAPAVAAFGNWKMGEQVQDKLLTPTKYVEVAKVLDGDTIEDADGTRYRIQGYDTFETGKRKGAVDEPFAREGEARLMSLVKPGQTVRVRSGTPEGAFMTDKYGRQLAYVETVPQAIAALPGVRRVWPGTDVASKLITEGLAQPRYEELNPAGHARQMRYNALAELAKDVQAGMWSPEGAKTVAEWPHKDLFVYKTFTERRDEAMRRAGIAPAESSRLLDAGMHIGSLGLMTTGNAGLFKYLPRSGNLAAQTWNAALAIGGGLQHNQRADNRPPPKPISKPRYLPDDYDLKLMSVGMQ
jgi:endonuclease YncB( thermonuclease family)